MSKKFNKKNRTNVHESNNIYRMIENPWSSKTINDKFLISLTLITK